MKCKTKGIIAVFCTCFSLSQPICDKIAYAEMTIGVFKKFEKGTDVEKVSLDSYVGGVGKGYLWANSNLRYQNRQPLFCFQGDMTTHEILKIASDEIKYVQRYKHIGDDTDVELVLLEKLKRLYPCTNKK